MIEQMPKLVRGHIQSLLFRKRAVGAFRSGACLSVFCGGGLLFDIEPSHESVPGGAKASMR